MRVAGLIAEFNPLHQGHLYLISQVRKECDVLVVILSGYFSQRGLPSLLSPSQKTRLALQAGADVILDLPVLYTCQSADRFAKAAVQSLSRLHVDTLYFGSESNDLQYLDVVSRTLDELEARPGTSMRQTTREIAGLKSNDLLAIQYLYWCRRYHIAYRSIQRQPVFESATQIRRDFFEGRWQIRSLLYHQLSWEGLYPYLRLFLQESDPALLREFLLVDEGIEHRLIEQSARHENWNGFLEACISKTYSRTRIQRTCLMVLLQVKRQLYLDHPDFLLGLVTGLSGRGRSYLRKHHQPEVLFRLRDYPDYLLNLHRKCSFLYYRKVVPFKGVIIYE